MFPFRGTYEDLPPSDMHAVEVRQSISAMQQRCVFAYSHCWFPLNHSLALSWLSMASLMRVTFWRSQPEVVTQPQVCAARALQWSGCRTVIACPGS